ncbi:MAG TPA: CotH kinase family protein, partial [Candidatus Acidoferrum sp.]|nr:CotH kinase family protein [Candidatus Acidoferrum sp.]
MRKELLLLLGGLLFTTAVHAASPVIISEFMANNNNSINDDFGNREDWIEIQNISGTNVNLAGWYLTDATNNLKLWQFPATNIAPNTFIVVFASDRNRRIPGAALHTSFKLNDEGDYLALVQPDGTNIATEFREKFPKQAADVSYGFASDARDIVLVETNAPAKALVPVADMGLLWTDIAFNDSSWPTGVLAVGYDRNIDGVDYNPYIGFNVDTAMYNVNQTIYVRIPFVVTNITEMASINLALLYEDGYMGYLNGQFFSRDNVTDPVTYTSGAGPARADGTAITPTNINLTALKSFLQIGTNVLSFQAINTGLASSDLLLGPKLTARTLPSGLLVARYFPVPTPGTNNNSGVAALGPIISEATHTPHMPQTTEAITVTAHVRQAFAPVATVKLRYRVMFTPEVEVSMFDDGLHGDGATNDGVFSGSIPTGIATPGQMIRWFVRATDTSNVVSRLPVFSEPLSQPEYFGTIVPIGPVNNLEVLHWFILNPTGADNTAGTRASLFYLGEFYDNVGMNLHGQSSAGFPKKSYDIDFHRSYNFRWALNEDRVDDINLLTIYPDKAHMRNVLSYETFRSAGTPYHFVVPVRVHQNGAFFSDAHMVENGDDNYLERLGMDTQGALYKMYNILDVATGEKKTRQNEGTQDLQDLINGSSVLTGAARKNYLFDNINLPEVTSYLAAQTIIGNTDCCHKNYYVYRDTEGTGEWQILPWDVDLSFGRVWSNPAGVGPTYWDDTLIPTTALFIGSNNRFVSAIYNQPETRQMYLRRLRTLMEELMQPPGTPAAEGKFEQRIDQLTSLIAPDAALDLAKWGTWCCSNAGPFTVDSIPIKPNFQTLPQAAAYIKTNYLPARRTYLFTQAAEVPASQP